MLTPAQAEERLRKIAIPASFPQVGRQPRLQPPSGSYPISGSGWKIPYVPTMRSAPQDRAPSAQLPPIGMFSTGSGAVSVHHTLPAPATIGGQAPQCMSPEASSANYPGKRIAHIPTMGGANPNHTIPNSLPSPPPLQGSYKRRADYNGAETPSNPGLHRPWRRKVSEPTKYWVAESCRMPADSSTTGLLRQRSHFLHLEHCVKQRLQEPSKGLLRAVSAGRR
jgi:hypothetical protein